MGRVKIAIKKLHNSNGRQSTYSKRKLGILKKAHELSILCDIDLILLMFSPTGKASICSGNKSVDEVIGRYAQLPAQERVKRKLEGLHALKKTFLKTDHDVNIPDFDGFSTSTTKDLHDEVVHLQNRLSEVQERLCYWTNPDSVNDTEVLNRIEDSVNESLRQIRMQKERVTNEEFMKLERNNQLQNDLELPFHANNGPQLQDLSTWIPFDGMPHMAVPPEELKLPPQRDVGCFSCQSSFPVPFASLDGQYPYPSSFNMMGYDKGFQNLLGMDLSTNTLNYDFEEKYDQPRNDAGSSQLLPMSCGDSIFGEPLDSQNGTVIPSPTAPSMYKTAANDPSRMLYDLLNAPN